MSKPTLTLILLVIPALAVAQVAQDERQQNRQDTYRAYNNRAPDEGRQEIYTSSPGNTQKSCYQTGNGNVICK